jgi:hypothetical protein
MLFAPQSVEQVWQPLTRWMLTHLPPGRARSATLDRRISRDPAGAVV